MHELGLTKNIVSIVSEHAGPRKVKRVCVAIGPRACVERQALSFCFDLVSQGTVLDGAMLEFSEAEGETFVIKEYELEEAAQMCGTCGCSDPKNAVTLTDVETGSATVLRHGAITASHGTDHVHAETHEHSHDHGHHDHQHDHNHDHHHHEHDDLPHVHGPNGEVITLETAVLAKNDHIATRNRGWFEGRGVLALNLVSSPGAGKTALLERTIKELDDLDICVIEGDQMTTNDADRIREAGARAVQINTGAGCHLEADMIASAVETLDPASGAVLFIENVGNLVCPAMFDLGERMKVAIISTTEGEDKPLKYPHMFEASDLVIINKIDLAPHVDFDGERCLANIAKVNPQAKVIQLSAKTGAGMDSWLEALRGLRDA